MPRVAAGEILPEHLIVIGQIAKDYGLYTKIVRRCPIGCRSDPQTGGQRLDMFGAQRADLPAIWKRLNDAGMESGHAYGKSLRTVKVRRSSARPRLTRTVLRRLDLVPLRHRRLCGSRRAA